MKGSMLNRSSWAIIMIHAGSSLIEHDGRRPSGTSGTSLAGAVTHESMIPSATPMTACSMGAP